MIGGMMYPCSIIDEDENNYIVEVVMIGRDTVTRSKFEVAKAFVKDSK